MQYTAIFHGCKNVNFQMKIFNIFAQNIDLGYTLEPPQRGGSNEYPQSMVFFFLFLLWFNVLVNNFSVMLRLSHLFLGITSTFGE